MSESTTQRPWYFSLIKDGDTAVVRLLHSKTDTIESVVSHRIEVDGKKKRVKCIGDGCPLCAKGDKSSKYIYVHLWDYTDNKEKVWERTDKIIPQLVTVQNAWNPLNTAVLKITRKGNEFPKYDIEVQNPMQYSNVDNALVDKQLAKSYSFSRNADEIRTFIATGKFPERKEFIPKEEYKKMKAAERANNTQASQSSTQSVAQNSGVANSDVDDPFADNLITPR